MALTGSGQISLLDIATEYGGSAPHALSEYHDKGNAPSSGEIQIAADFYGTSNALYVTATGGTVTTSGDYKIHTFTGSSTFSISEAGNVARNNSYDLLVVAGGGPGGSYPGGGGGAGGVRTQTNTASAGSTTVTIGAGAGGGSGISNGSNTSFGGTTPTGGGRGGSLWN